MRVAKAAIVKLLSRCYPLDYSAVSRARGSVFCSLKFAVNLVFWVTGVTDYHLYHFDNIFKCW